LAVVTATEEGASATAIPVVLQALRALESDADQRANILVRPLPSIPERADELRSFRGLVIDDPPGFSPEQRRALAGFVEGGGVLLLGLGPSAARGRLGQTFEPWIMHPMAFGPTPVPGVAPPVTGESAPDRASSAMALSPWEGFERSGMEALGARGRVTFAPTDRQLFATVGPWADGEPLIAHRTIGLGELFVTTLPFSTDTSDFPLRPAFLDLLDKVRTATLGHASPRRTVAGTRWSLGADVVSVGRFSRGAKSVPEEILPREAGASGPSVAPTHLGAYDVVRRLSSCKGDGASDSTGCQQTERRVVAPSLDEIGPAPRPLPEGISGMKGASAAAQTDVSWMVALGVLGLVALELLLRLFARFPSAEGALAAEGALPIPSPTADKE
jgi:hypothetical protein